jgi:hypothetical protein
MAFKIEDDSISLRSYNNTRNDSVRPKKESLFITGNNYEKPSTRDGKKEDDNYSRYDDNLSINQIYNQNLKRIRHLNNIEEDLYNNSEFKKVGNKFEEEKYVNLDKHNNFDEFLNKLNNINKL